MTNESPKTGEKAVKAKAASTSHADNLAESKVKAAEAELLADQEVAAENEARLAAEAEALATPAEVSITLDDYARMRGVSPFGVGVIVAGARDHNRPFSEWEKARQLLLGG